MKKNLFFVLTVIMMTLSFSSFAVVETEDTLEGENAAAPPNSTLCEGDPNDKGTTTEDVRFDKDGNIITFE